jgi:hypothetical protein
MEWDYFLNSEPSESEKIRYQLAIHTANSMSVQGVKDVKISDYFFDFSEKEKEEQGELTELEKARMQNKKMKQKFLKEMKGE